MNAARRPIWLLLIVAICAVASVMGMATSANLAASLPGAAGTPTNYATPNSRSATPMASPTAPSNANRSVFPSTTEINDIDSPGPEIARNAIPTTVPLAKKRIYDTGLLIGTENEKTLEGTARVLASYGVPILVYVRRSPDSIAESQAYADNLRSQRHVESAPGADDGLVVLLTVNNQFAYSGKVVFSTGAHTLPVHGLDQEVLDEIQEADIVPNLRQGKIFDALNLSLRHMSYAAQFVPGQVAQTSLRQDMVSSLLLVIAPIGTVLLALGSGILWIVPGSQFQRIGLRHRPVNKGLILAGLGFATILAILSVYSRSATGVGCALLAFIVLAANGLMGRTHANGIKVQHRNTRVLRVHPRLTFRRHRAPGASATPSSNAPVIARRRP